MMVLVVLGTIVVTLVVVVLVLNKVGKDAFRKFF